MFAMQTKNPQKVWNIMRSHQITNIPKLEESMETIVDIFFELNKEDAITLARKINNISLFNLKKTKEEFDQDLYRLLLRLKNYFIDKSKEIAGPMKSTMSNGKRGEEFYKAFGGFGKVGEETGQILWMPHASLIELPETGGDKKVILSAAPLYKDHCFSFWNMIWEQDVKVISCLIEYHPSDFSYFNQDKLEFEEQVFKFEKVS